MKRSHLDDNDTYILELYDQVYVWQGNGASPKEKMMGVKMAKDFITDLVTTIGWAFDHLPRKVKTKGVT